MIPIQMMLNEMLEVYKQKQIFNDSIRVQFESLPDHQFWGLIIQSGEISNIKPGTINNPDITFMFSEETLSAIHSGKITGLTAVGRENMSDETPLNFRLGLNVTMTPDLMNKLLNFIQRFFNPTYPEVVKLEKEFARLVHGAWAIPMFYHTGFRSAWYQVEKGQQLNEPGDTNPFAQAFVIVEGHGYAKIGDNSISVHSGEAFFIPPETEHMLWTEDDGPLKLIYLAWGENA